MEIADFTGLIPPEDAEEFRGDNPLAPVWPFRLLIVGPSNCGKTNLLLNLLVKHLNYDNLFLYSRHLDQPLYKFLIDDIAPKISQLITHDSDIQNMTPLEDLSKEERNLYVFDDFVNEKKQSQIVNVFTNGRHSNCSCIYLAQTYFPVPRGIRLNTNYFAFFDIHSQRLLSELQSDHATNIDGNAFRDLFSQAVKEPYSFFLIDRHSKLLPLNYRRCFNGLNNL